VTRRDQMIGITQQIFLSKQRVSAFNPKDLHLTAPLQYSPPTYYHRTTASVTILWSAEYARSPPGRRGYQPDPVVVLPLVPPVANSLNSSGLAPRRT
jgi:hypothetical protein